MNTLHWNFDFRLLVRLFFGQYRFYPFFGKNPCLTQLFHLNGLCERRCGFSFVDIIGKIFLFLHVEIGQFNRRSKGDLTHIHIFKQFGNEIVEADISKYLSRTFVCFFCHLIRRIIISAHWTLIIFHGSTNTPSHSFHLHLVCFCSFGR